MQEQLDGSNKNEPEDKKGPRQDDGVGACTRCEGEPCDIAPETCHRDDRKGVDQDDPCGKSSRFDRTAPAELDHQNDGKDRTSDCAAQRPNHRVGDMNEVEKCGNQSKSSDYRKRTS